MRRCSSHRWWWWRGTYILNPSSLFSFLPWTFYLISPPFFVVFPVDLEFLTFDRARISYRLWSRIWEQLGWNVVQPPKGLVDATGWRSDSMVWLHRDTGRRCPVSPGEPLVPQRSTRFFIYLLLFFSLPHMHQQKSWFISCTNIFPAYVAQQSLVA